MVRGKNLPWAYWLQLEYLHTVLSAQASWLESAVADIGVRPLRPARTRHHPAERTNPVNETVSKPWPALWALVIGFFMILVDSTIVSVANPAILRDLDADITSVIWVTSGYLLAYAVPLLITGRLGDRFGPKRMYMIGLVVFTAASAWCGFADSIGTLVAARVVQGLGAALMTPQTMAVITRIFPPNKRGAAMGLWGSVAGIATLVGPILGGVLVDNLGWEWIFFVNVPVGVVALVLAWRLVPNLETHAHSFDWLGVLLSAAGLFLVIFGIQEGDTYDWGTIAGPITVWSLIITGIVVLIGFVVWQRYNPKEPLLPLGLFKDRNFALSNAAIALVGLAITAMPLPISFYYQVARGMLPTQSALMLAPMAVATLIMAPIVGRLTDRVNPKWVAIAGFSLSAVSLLWLSSLMNAGDRAVEAADPGRLPRHRHVGHLVTARRHRHPQPADGSGRRGLRRLQHDPPGGRRARQRRHRRPDQRPTGRRAARLRDRDGARVGGVDPAGRSPSRLQHGDGPVTVAARGGDRPGRDHRGLLRQAGPDRRLGCAGREARAGDRGGVSLSAPTDHPSTMPLVNARAPRRRRPVRMTDRFMDVGGRRARGAVSCPHVRGTTVERDIGAVSQGCGPSQR